MNKGLLLLSARELVKLMLIKNKLSFVNQSCFSNVLIINMCNFYKAT